MVEIVLIMNVVVDNGYWIIDIEGIVDL